ncbi:MAG: GAF domain-containing protein [Bacteroidia bacterium]|nr:GAF domain-containing protein [Bacteroidia bacterium]
MSDFSKMTKAELIEELKRLREQPAESTVAIESNGQFDEDELFDMVRGQEGDELFVVTETGRFVYANDSLLRDLGYSLSTMLSMTLSRIDTRNTRATWLHRVSQLKQQRIPDVFETEFLDAAGVGRAKTISANYIAWRGKNYILCVSRSSSGVETEGGNVSTVKSRDQVLQQTTFDGVLIVDTRGTIVESNQIADRLLGMTKADLSSRSCIDPRWRFIDADGQPLTVSSHPLMIALVEEHPVLNRKIGMLQPDGSKRFITINASPLFEQNGDLFGAVGCFRLFEDSAERNDAMKREIALMKVQAEVVNATLTANSEYDLERTVCEILVKHLGYPLVWRGVTGENDMRVNPSASAGKDHDYLRKIKIRYDDSPFGRGPIGKALKTGQPVTVADILADPDSATWKAQNEKTHFQSLAALPLMYEGAELGVLVLYARDKNHFIGPEYERLREIVRILAFGIGQRRRIKDAESRIAEAAMQQRLLEAYQTSLAVAVAVFDAREPFRCVSVNDTFSEILDEPFRSRGVEGQLLSDFIYSLYHRDLYDRLVEAVEAGDLVTRSHDVFTDWQGQQTLWSWSLTPHSEKDGDEQFLYLAWKHEGAAAIPTQSESAVLGGVTQAPPHECGVVSVTYPKFGPRSKLGTRIQRFLNEGRTEILSPGAVELLCLEGEVGNPARQVFPANEATQILLDTVLSEKESAIRFSHTNAEGRDVNVTLFFDVTDDAQQVWLFTQPAT